MLTIFDAFFFTQKYWDEVNSGIRANDDDSDLDYKSDYCELRKTGINLKRISVIKPIDEGLYTYVSDGNDSFVINVPFNDFLAIIPSQSYSILKSKWAN